MRLLLFPTSTALLTANLSHDIPNSFFICNEILGSNKQLNDEEWENWLWRKMIIRHGRQLLGVYVFCRKWRKVFLRNGEASKSIGESQRYRGVETLSSWNFNGWIESGPIWYTRGPIPYSTPPGRPNYNRHVPSVLVWKDFFKKTKVNK